ncbi:MAG: glycosyltransferase family 2 protein [Candidatus Gracilibacteria bacterium]|nr:glycosyltransferase family 2 protein [Candidatus Gracilibacteria bacterium]
MPKVSILVCSYNAGKYVAGTIRSVLDQTYVDFELLILDNASTDGTREYIKEFNDPRITLFEGQENIGPYAGLNYLLKRAKGEYIAIQDHDDIWHPEKLARQVAFLDENNEYVGCACTMVMYYEADRKYFEYFLGDTTDYALHPSIVYRNKANLRYDVNIPYMTDAYFLKQTLCQGQKRIHNLRDSLALHIVKGAHGNYSYRWFQLNMANIRRIIQVHGHSLYSLVVLGFEIQRKILYPVLNKIRAFALIAQIERLPFRILGYKVHSADAEIKNPMIQKLFSYLLVK